MKNNSGITGNQERSIRHNTAIYRVARWTIRALFAMAFLNVSNSANAFDFPHCSDTKVEKRILKDFNWAENRTWQRGFDLVSLSRMHEHRTVSYEGSIVTRRYCMADAHFSNGTRRSIYYMINNRGGFAGIWWRVTHCVAGLDPWRNHDGNCRAIR